MSMQICLPDNIDIVALFADCDIDFNDPVIFPKKRSDEYIEWQEREAERQNKKIERARQYYWEHLEYYREYEKKRRAKQREYLRAYRAANHEILNEKRSKYRAANRDKINAMKRECYARKTDKYREYSCNYYAKRKAEKERCRQPGSTSCVDNLSENKDT